MRIFETLRRVPTRVTAAVAIVAAVLVVPAMLHAWGPTRATYTVAQPADHVTFNSITDNPVVGDERQFVGIKDAGNTASGGWQNNVTATPGHEYLVRIYVHNNAAEKLNLVALNTRVTAALSTATGKKVPITGYVSADNATPKQVYADVNLTSSENFNVAYVPGSAMIYNNATGAGGRAVSDSIVNGGGAPIGYAANDGKLPGCFQYASYVTFKVKPQFAQPQTPNFTVAKTVRVNGAQDTTFKENVSVKPGDKVDFQVYFKNTGSTQLTNVAIRDKLPTGLTYVPGTTWLHNSSGTRQVADGVTSAGGLGIGGYLPNGDAYVKFTAQVASNDKLSVCGANTLKNIASVDTDQGSKSDDAAVTTTKTCQPTPVYTCDSLTVTKLSRTQFKFATAYTAKDGAVYKSTNYVVKNAAGATVYSDPNTTYTQTTAGTYTVQATVTFTVNGSDKTATKTDCKKSFEVTPETPTPTPGVSIAKTVDGKKDEMVEVNKPFVYHLTVKNTGNVDLTNVSVSDNAPAHVQFISADKGTITDNKWSYVIASLKVGTSQTFAITAKVTQYVEGTITNTACVDAPQVPGTPDDCDTATVEVPKENEIIVCDLRTNTYPVTIKESDFDSSKYSKNPADCQETPVTPTIPVCDTKTHEVVTIKKSDFDASKYSKDTDHCVAMPAELPTTGAADVFARLAGVISLAGATAYYVASRRNS